MLLMGSAYLPIAEAQDCRVIRPARCWCKADGIESTNTQTEGCWSQNLDQQKCASACLTKCTERGNWYNQIKSAKVAAGACGTVNVNIRSHVGTYAERNAGSCSVDVGGTWIAATNPTCPAGYNFPGTFESYCVQDVVPSNICPSGYNPSGAFPGKCEKVVQGCGGLSIPQGHKVDKYVYWNGNLLVADKDMTYCPDGYTYGPAFSAKAVAAGYAQKQTCRKTIAAIAGAAAYCKR